MFRKIKLVGLLYYFFVLINLWFELEYLQLIACVIVSLCLQVLIAFVLVCLT